MCVVSLNAQPINRSGSCFIERQVHLELTAPCGSLDGIYPNIFNFMQSKINFICILKFRKKNCIVNTSKSTDRSLAL